MIAHLAIEKQTYKPVGLTIESNGSCIYSWGVQPTLDSYYVTKLPKDYETELIALIKNQVMIDEEEQFVRRFHEVLNENGPIDIEGKFTFTYKQVKERLERLREERENIINNLVQ